MTDDRLRVLYQAALQRRRGASDVTPEALEALAAGTLPEAERLALLDRVMADEGLRQEFELLRSVHSAGEGHAGAMRAEQPRTGTDRVSPHAMRRPLYLGLGLAAAVLVAVGLWIDRGGRGEPSDPMRGAASTLRLHSPEAGSVAPVPVQLAWAAVERATSYRVELLNGAGATVLTRIATDTTLTLRPEDGLAPGAYRWWVEAHVPTGHVRSDMRELRLQAP